MADEDYKSSPNSVEDPFNAGTEAPGGGEADDTVSDYTDDSETDFDIDEDSEIDDETDEPDATLNDGSEGPETLDPFLEDEDQPKGDNPNDYEEEVPV